MSDALARPQGPTVQGAGRGRGRRRKRRQDQLAQLNVGVGLIYKGTLRSEPILKATRVSGPMSREQEGGNKSRSDETTFPFLTVFRKREEK